MDFLQAVTHNEGSVFQRTFSFKVHKIAKKNYKNNNTGNKLQRVRHFKATAP